MNGRKFLLVTIAFLVLAGLSTVYVRPAYAAPVYLVNLDANSISQTDLALQPTFGPTHGFRVGALVNATSANPLLNVQGFQFTVHYNATAFAPQGDPNAGAVPGNTAALYVDGATNTVLFGANPNIVNNAGVVENWNGLLTSGAAFRVITVAVTGSAGALTVAYSILGTGTQVRIAGPNLLANVAFELINKPSTLQSFTIGDVIFVDNTGALIPSVSAGAGATETVGDIPPVARFTTTHLATGAPDCTPVTGAAGAAYAFKVDGSASTDETPLRTAAGTAGFFWDFGDQQQDGFYPGSTFTAPVTCTNANLVTFTCQGAVAIHDYGVANPSTGIVPAPGKFNVTLRVQDAQADTGAARNSLGAPYVRVATPPGACSSPDCTSNTQPSHGQQLNLLADIPPTASFTPTSTTCTSPCTVTFNAVASAPGQVGTTISSYTWNFGDGNTTTVATNTIFHTYTAAVSTTFPVTLTVTDNLGATGSATGSVMVGGGLAKPTVTISSLAPNPGVIGQVVTVTFTATNSPTAVTVKWGDGTAVDNLPGTATTDTHTYALSGVFTVNVTATNSAGTGFATMSETVNKRTTSTTVVCSPASVPIGQPSTCTATVTDTNGAVGATTPAGSVSFTSSGGAGTFSTPASCTLTAAGTCTVTFTPSSTTLSTITGAYTASDSRHAGSTSSGAGNGSVTGVLRTTSTTVVCSPASVPIGQPSTCTATVVDTNGAPGVASPSGSVTFTSAGAAGTLGTPNPCTLVASATVGTSTCSVTFTPRADCLATITCAYGGSMTHAASTSSCVGNGSVTCVLRTTSTTVFCCFFFNDTAPTEIYTLSLHDALPISGVASPSGSVTFTSAGAAGTLGTPNPCTLVASATVGTSTCSDPLTPRLNSSPSLISASGFCLNHTASTSSGAGNGSVTGVLRTT